MLRGATDTAHSIVLRLMFSGASVSEGLKQLSRELDVLVPGGHWMPVEVAGRATDTAVFEQWPRYDATTLRGLASIR